MGLSGSLTEVTSEKRTGGEGAGSQGQSEGVQGQQGGGCDRGPSQDQQHSGWWEAEWCWAGGQGGRQAGKASCKLTALAWYLSDKGASTPYHTPSYCCPIPGEPD